MLTHDFLGEGEGKWEDRRRLGIQNPTFLIYSAGQGTESDPEAFEIQSLSFFLHSDSGKTR